MFTTQLFDPPDKAETIAVWRYMDFAKFVSMLIKQGIYFCSVKALIDLKFDPWEAAFPFAHTKENPAIPADLSTFPEAEKVMSGLRRLTVKQLLSKTYISSWHMATHESAAMWKLYAQTSDAIAIQTTYQKLMNAMSPALVARVNYIDYNTDCFPSSNLFAPFLHKRLSFKHEQEVRALFFENTDTPASGIVRKVDLNALIDAIHIAPNAPSYFAEVVEQTIVKFGYKFSAHQSFMDSPALR